MKVSSLRTGAVVACLLGVLAGCHTSAPPALSGLWSSGPAGCEAGIGVRFQSDAIAAFYGDERETLFAQPKYEVLSAEGGLRLRIEYALPRRPGGAHSAGAHGVIELEQREDGSLAPLAHTLFDPRTGSARVRFVEDAAIEMLALMPCGPTHAPMGLRGRNSV